MDFAEHVANGSFEITRLDHLLADGLDQMKTAVDQPGKIAQILVPARDKLPHSIRYALFESKSCLGKYGGSVQVK